MSREAPFSSITAGPSRSTAAPLQDDDDSSEPTSTTSDTFTLTLRRTVSSSSSTPSPTLPPTTEATHPPPMEAPHHSNLGAGLGGGLGGAAAVLMGIALFFYSRRKQRRVSVDEGSKYHEMDTPDAAHRHNSRLFPAELHYEDSKVSLAPAELGSSKTTAAPVGPYELQGDLYEMEGDTEAIAKDGDSGGHQDKPLSENTTTSPTYSSDIKTTKAKESSRDSPIVDDMTIVSDLSDIRGTAARGHRPSAQNRPDSTYSPSGPWHDNY
ncbi:MAG: hypothetical protein Q9224_000343 [Gallowayella concinna]